MNQKNIASHVASIVALVTAILAALHPGVTLPPNTAPVAVGLLVTFAGVIQSINTFFHTSNAGKKAIVQELAKKVIADFQSGTTVVKPASVSLSAEPTETVAS